MATSKRSSRYESWVHLGFLAIVLLLFALNVASNYVIFQDRTILREATLSHLRTAALGISRAVQAKTPELLTQTEEQALVSQYNLSDLNLVHSRPNGPSGAEKRAWLSSVIHRLPPGQLPGVAEKLFEAEVNRLTRGDESEYYYLYPVEAPGGGHLLIVSVERERLANYDDMRMFVLAIQLAALALAGVAYAYLSRYIFKPLRRIKEQAARAGRAVDDTDDTEAIVTEYRAVIERLQQSETELLRLNAAIQSKADSLEQFNQYLFESNHAGIITLDPRGGVVAVNETAAGLLRLGAAPAIGLDYAGLLADMGDLRADVRSVVDHGVTTGYKEYHNLLPDYPEVVVGASISIILDKAQNRVGLLILVNDLTELVRLRRELENQNRLAALGEMAGGLAHQMRNSLGAISGYGTLLKKRLKREGLALDTAETLLDEAGEAESLIGRFLSYARPLEFSPEKCSVHRLINETIRQFRARDDSRDAEFKLNLCEDFEVAADDVLFRQVLCNVVDNAINAYDARRGAVEIEVEATADRAEIRIRDFGCGIPAEDVDRIFTPFFSSRPSGTGLGLSLVAKIVRVHGGRTNVRSA
ncbi:MAG: hypothetical protein GY867_02495, partial [bacterium]|nr:hypothetical protein [bacterium]